MIGRTSQSFWFIVEMLEIKSNTHQNKYVFNCKQHNKNEPNTIEIITHDDEIRVVTVTGSVSIRLFEWTNNENSEFISGNTLFNKLSHQCGRLICILLPNTNEFNGKKK